MTKLTKRFEFLYPINNISFGINRKPKLIGTLKVSYIGYDHKISYKDNEERYELDIDSIKWGDIELFDLLQSEQFASVFEEIQLSADNNIHHAFQDYYEAKERDMENDLYDEKREALC